MSESRPNVVVGQVVTTVPRVTIEHALHSAQTLADLLPLLPFPGPRSARSYRGTTADKRTLGAARHAVAELRYRLQNVGAPPAENEQPAYLHYPVTTAITQLEQEAAAFAECIASDPPEADHFDVNALHDVLEPTVVMLRAVVTQSSAGPPPPPPTGDAEAFTADELRILTYLDERRPQLMRQVDIAADTRFGEKHVRACLKKLRAAGYTHRPEGLKKGETITAQGQALLKSAAK